VDDESLPSCPWLTLIAASAPYIDLPGDHAMNQQESLPAPEFSRWLRDTREMLCHDGDADVPCGECNTCCRSSYFIHVGQHEDAARAAIPRELLFSAPGAPEGTLVMGYDENGCCPMLRDAACTIYLSRPHTCRAYDCRVFAATGMQPEQPGVAAQAHRWAFGFSTDQDRGEYRAVRAAASFLREHADQFPAGFLPSNSVQLAVLAVKVHSVFLGIADGALLAETADESLRLVGAVTKAAEVFGIDREGNTQNE
jgi:Fe-S-cluster containining protein